MMQTKDGSYVVAGFYQRAVALLAEKGEVAMIGKIFQEIQDELGDWKQLPVYVPVWLCLNNDTAFAFSFTWNNDTANVTFKRRPLSQEQVQAQVQAAVKGGGGMAGATTGPTQESHECKACGLHFLSKTGLATHPCAHKAEAKDATVVVLDGDDAQIVEGGAADDIQLVYDDAADADDDDEKYPGATQVADMEMVATNVHIEVQSEAQSEQAWEQWSAAEVAAWIVSLNPANYAQYEKVLARAMSEEDVDGESLELVDIKDLQRWGIKSFKHNKLILVGIRKLVVTGLN